ncbi:hypothetical protein ACEQPO_31435 [Bacillus sp. SL00103]
MKKFNVKDAEKLREESEKK